MKKNYTIAVCDILGFSQLVESNSLDAVVDNAIDWFRRATCHAMNKNGWPETTPSLAEINSNSRIGLAWFSDTVFLYTKEDEEENLSELIQTVAWLLFSTMQATTKMRAGIAYGEAFIDSENALYVGTPIIEAYKMEQRQQWSGAALTDSAVDRIPKRLRKGTFADWPLVPYPVPLKKGMSEVTLAVDWTYGIHREMPLEWSSKSREPTEEDWSDNRSVCEKWRNTRDFHDSVCRHCNQ